MQSVEFCVPAALGVDHAMLAGGVDLEGSNLKQICKYWIIILIVFQLK